MLSLDILKIAKEEKELNLIIEKLSDLEHQQWAHWAQSMLDNPKITMDDERRERWERQINTPYGQLPTPKGAGLNREVQRKS